MVCQKCGTQCADDAVYCGACGNRLDGKKRCPSCEKWVDGNFAYCSYCGVRIDGKKTCQSCGTVYEGKFCVNCGTAAESVVKTGYANVATPSTSTPKKEKRLSAKTSAFSASTFALVGALFALIFVFCIGIKSVALGMDMGEKTSLFYYFSDYFEEMEALELSELGFTPWYEKTVAAMLNQVGVFGAIIAGFGLISVGVLSIVTIAVYVRNVLGYSEKKADVWGIAAMVAYLLCSLMFIGYHKVSADYEGLEEMATIQANGATVAGIVLCSIALAGCVINRMMTDVIEKGKLLFTSRYITKVVCSIIGIICVSVALAFAKNIGVSLRFTVLGETTSIAGCYPLASASFAMAFGAYGKELPNYYAVSDAIYTMHQWNLTAQIFLMIAMAFMAMALICLLSSFSSKKKTGLIVVAFFAVCAMVFVLVSGVMSMEAAKQAFSYSVDSARTFKMDSKIVPHIIALVCSVLLIAVSIANIVLRKREKEAEEAAKYVFNGY